MDQPNISKLFQCIWECIGRKCVGIYLYPERACVNISRKCNIACSAACSIGVKLHSKYDMCGAVGVFLTICSATDG